MIEMHVVFDGDFSPERIMSQYGLEPNGRVQLTIDESVVRFLDAYWAKDTGLLAESVIGQGTGELTYYQPYAHYQYYGVSRSGKPLNYSKEKNPLAGAFPLERMKADHMDDIVQEAVASARNQ